MHCNANLAIVFIIACISVRHGNSQVVISYATPIVGPAGSSISVGIAANVGMQALIVTLGPCTLLTTHSHPRGAELATTLEGLVKNVVVLENGTFVTADVGPMKAFTFPQGLIHYQYNPTCKTSRFIAQLPADAGLQLTYPSLLSLPAGFKTTAFDGPLPAFKGALVQQEGCLKGCGL